MWSGWRHRTGRKQRSIKGQSNPATVSSYTSPSTIELTLIFSYQPSYPTYPSLIFHPPLCSSFFAVSYILPSPSPLLPLPSPFPFLSSPRGDTLHPRCVPDAFYQSRISCRLTLSTRDVQGGSFCPCNDLCPKPRVLGVSDEGKCVALFPLYFTSGLAKLWKWV